MGIELEIFILFAIHVVGIAIFGRFETETPAIRRIAKWFIITGVTIAIYYWLGHWALLFLAVLFVGSITLHFYICKKKGFHPLKATPRRKYYEFRKWKWEE